MGYVYLVKRVAAALASLFGVATIAFVLFRIVPGDPARLLTGPGVRAEDIEGMRVTLGLSDSLPIQFVNWINGLLHLDFGRSFWLRTNALDAIIDRLPATLELVFSAMILATIVGVVLAIVSVRKRNQWPEKLATSISFFGISIPDFLWGILFIIIFGGIFSVLPISGRIAPLTTITQITRFMVIDSILTGNYAAFIDSIAHLILPALALSFELITVISRTLKSSLLDVMQEDYIFTDRTKGLSERYIFFVRGLKNAAIPMITILGVQMNFLIGGSLMVELIFGWPGIGTLALNAVNRRDLPVIQGIIMTYAVVVIVSNLVIDLIYSKLNPKITYQ